VAGRTADPTALILAADWLAGVVGLFGGPSVTTFRLQQGHVACCAMVPGRGWVILMLVGGGVVQLVGLMTVIVQLSSSRREARSLTPATTDPRTGRLGQSYEQSQRASEAVPAILRGSPWQWVGVFMLAVGLATQTAAAVWALFLGPS
jgi:hypothetical protein